MKAPITPNLLRRTAVVLVAAAASFIALPASSATITLGGSSAGENCAYSQMSVDPAGNVTVTCSVQASGGLIGGSTTPPPSTGTPTVYISNSFSQLPLSASSTGVAGDPPAAGATPSNVYIARTNATAGDISVAYNISGGGCYVNGFPQPATGAVTISGTALQSQPIGLVVTTPGTICSMAIISVSPTSGGTMATGTVTGIANSTAPAYYVSIPVSTTLGGGSTPPPSGGGGGGTIPTVSGCPAPAAGTVMATFPATQGTHMANDGSTNGYWIEPSGVITAVPLPTLPTGYAQGSVQLTYGSRTPLDPAMYEISISKCPGVIDTNATQTGSPLSCYYGSSNPANDTVFWYGRNSTKYTLTQLASQGKCTADETKGPWYANIRYTYSGCSAGPDKCGQQVQWNATGF